MSRGLEGKASQDTKIRRGLPLRPCYGNLGSQPLTPVTDATRDVCPCPRRAPHPVRSSHCGPALFRTLSLNPFTVHTHVYLLPLS